MGNWWSHHGETVMATVIGVVFTILVAAIVFRLQRIFRRLSYSVIARRRLVPVSGYQQYSDLQIQFRNDPVSEPWIVIIRIVNTGRQDIGPSDITKPISIDLGDNSRIRDARVTGSTPEDVYEPEPLKVDEMGRPFLNPVAINRGNSIQIQLLLDGEPEKVEVIGRGVGVDMITELEAQRRDEETNLIAKPPQSVVLLLSIVTALAAIGGTLIFSLIVRGQNNPTAISGPTLASITFPVSGSPVKAGVNVRGTIKNVAPGNIILALISTKAGEYSLGGTCIIDNQQMFNCPIYLYPMPRGSRYEITVVSADAVVVAFFTNNAPHSPTTLPYLPTGATILSSVLVKSAWLNGERYR